MDETESYSEEECPEQIEETQDEEAEAVDEAKDLPSRFNQPKKQLPIKFTPGIDLPGRVSFSSDVFEIDYSDLSDESPFDGLRRSSQQSIKKVVHFEEKPSTKTLPGDSEVGEMEYSQKSDSSAKIIEDYKREIESLNRRHVQEMTKLNTEQKGVLFFDNSNSMLPGVDSVDSAHNTVLDNYLETIKTDSLEVFEQLETEIMLENEEPSDEMTMTPKRVHLERSVTSTWDNSQRTDEKVCSSSSDEKVEEVEGEGKEVIPPQELNREEERPRIKFNVRKNVAQKPLPRNLPRKPQTTRFNPVKPQQPPEPPKMRKAKSVSSLKEDNQLRDFQMDKIDSWMSINQEQQVDSMRALMLMKRPQSSHTQYNKEWRDTPTSKTDDEGNFSLEEANDCFSNESTTYDELVSIIKEIEADKKKTEERKNLQSDVEFTLKTELTQMDLKDPPASDPVK